MLRTLTDTVAAMDRHVRELAQRTGAGEPASAEVWSAPVKKRTRKNPRAVALGRKGGLVQSRKKTIAARRNARRPRPRHRKKE